MIQYRQELTYNLRSDQTVPDKKRASRIGSPGGVSKRCGLEPKPCNDTGKRISFC